MVGGIVGFELGDDVGPVLLVALGLEEGVSEIDGESTFTVEAIVVVVVVVVVLPGTIIPSLKRDNINLSSPPIRAKRNAS